MLETFRSGQRHHLAQKVSNADRGQPDRRATKTPRDRTKSLGMPRVGSESDTVDIIWTALDLVEADCDVRWCVETYLRRLNSTIWSIDVLGRTFPFSS